jgi:fatty acid desaturase
MTASVEKRDYSLTGPLNARAVQIGLANAEWYKSPISRGRMKELMKRSDSPATRDTLLWVGLMVLTGGLGAYLWGSWLCVPFFLIYGVLYGSGGDSRWHECGHGTAFKTQWKNDAVYQLACFLMIRNPVVWRWSHSRHHTDTIIVGRDPEIIAMRPPDMVKVALNFFGIIDVPLSLAAMLRYAAGRLTAAEEDFIPDSERHKVFGVARIWTAIYLATVGACFWMGSILPLMLIGLPRMYGAWHHVLTGLTQHVGLAEDVLDFRLNCRTVYINPFSRFVYWNMNYHVEHHMFPMVPYHALPALHREMLADCPKPYSSFWEAYREIIPTLFRQLRDPTYFVRRTLPPTARPAQPGPLAAELGFAPAVPASAA